VELRGTGRAWFVWASGRHCAGLAEAARYLDVSMARTMIAFCKGLVPGIHDPRSHPWEVMPTK
jgi:hypothetical protein